MNSGTVLTILCGGMLHELLSDPEQPFPTPMLYYQQILLYPFAAPESRWGEIFARFKRLPFTDPHEVIWELASADDKIRRAQRRMANWIVVPGGDERLIRGAVPDRELSEIAEGWNLLGASAGTNVFATQYYSNDRQRIERGSAALPINTICHFSPEKEERLATLRLQGGGLPTVALREREARVIRRQSLKPRD